MASNKWLRDFECGVSLKVNPRKPRTRLGHIKHSNAESFYPRTQREHSSPSRTLNWGDYWEPVEKNYDTTLDSLRYHRPRCKRQVADKPTIPKHESASSIGDMQISPSMYPEGSISTRELVFNLGTLGRTRSSSVFLNTFDTESSSNIEPLLIHPVRSQQHRLAPFIARKIEAPTEPIKPVSKPLKKMVNYVRAANSLTSISSNDRFDVLSQPRIINSKVGL